MASLLSKNEPSLQLNSATSSLQKTISGLTDVFGGISENLDYLDQKTKGLRTDCNVLLKSAGGQNDSTNLLLRVADTIQSPTSYLKKCVKKQTQNCELMRSCDKTAEELLKMQNQMIAALEPLKFMLVFFKIEASQLSEANRQTFHSVSEEISHLHILVDETFQRNIRKLAEARGKISTAETVAEREKTEQAKLIGSQQNEISIAIENLKVQIESNSKKSVGLDHAAESFEAALGILVMSLQYEDIIRQRCESILSQLDNKPSNVGNRTWLLVQAKQIETAAEEMRQSSREIKSGLEHIAAQAKELYTASTTMDQFEHITASADGMVQTLLESLDTVREVLKQSTTRSKNSRAAIEPVQSLTKELSAIVFEVSIKIQFIALNAQVRSIQVGEGSGLEILAARTAEISSQLRDLGDQTSIHINELHSDIDSLMNNIDEEYEQGKEQYDFLETHGQALESDLHTLRDSTFASLETVASLTESVQQFIESDIQNLGTLEELAQKLDEEANKLRAEANIEGLPPRKIKKIESEVGSLMDNDRDSMHTRLHAQTTDREAGFELAISDRAQKRSNSAKTLSCENIEMF